MPNVKENCFFQMKFKGRCFCTLGRAPVPSAARAEAKGIKVDGQLVISLICTAGDDNILQKMCDSYDGYPQIEGWVF